MKRKYLLTILSFALTANCFAQDVKSANFQIIDISQKQLRIMNALKDADSISRSNVFADSLYYPYKAF